MILNTIIFSILSVLIVFSTLGYGLVFTNKILQNNQYLNLPIKGIFGIFFLYIISSVTHLVVPHNYTHNIILLIIGLLIFSIFLKKGFVKKKELKTIFFVFAFLFIGFLISKTNEDFPYYHLPNSLQFSTHKLEFGLGNINHGFKHVSSIFLINSVFYLPHVEVYLYNITNFLLQIFFFSGIIIFIKKKNLNNFSKILITFSLITFLTKFYRLSEYGSDYIGQFLVLLSFIFASFALSKKRLNIKQKEQLFLISILLIVFSITTKFLYVIYIIIPLILFLYLFSFREIIKFSLNKKMLLVSTFSISLFIFFNFTATGCFLYPVSLTCLTESIDWTISETTIKSLNLHYKAWSKAGIGTGYGITNHQEYISGINWVDNWFKKYFFTKVSDYLLILILISLIFVIFFKKHFTKNHKIDFNIKAVVICYLSITIVFLLWFFNFPTLRYAGYTIVFLILVLPISLFLAKNVNFSKKVVIKKINILLIMAVLIFNAKNVQRLNKEFNYSNNEHHNFYNFPYFWVDDVKFKTILIEDKYFYEIIDNKFCWNVPSTCLKDISLLKIEKKKGYFFYRKK